MHKDRLNLAFLVCLGVLTVAGAVIATRRIHFRPQERSQAPEARLLRAYGQLPLSFEANRGQTDAQVRFLARGSGYTLFLTSNAAVLALATAESGRQKAESRKQKPEDDLQAHRPSAVLRMALLNARPEPQVVGVDELPGKTNYFIGNDPHRWRTNIATYRKVRYRSIYPGIDLVYYGNQGRLEYDFVVSPGASPQEIELGFETAVESRKSKVESQTPFLNVDSNGDLIVSLDGETVQLRKPLAYQTTVIRNSKLRTPNSELRTPVDARYVLESRNRVGIRLAGYDPSQPLVIDPVLTYSTYLGGSGADVANGIAIDAQGDAYVTGATLSTNFPTAPSSPLQSSNGGQSQVFVTKLNPAGTAPVYSTYLGGNGFDQGNAIAVDSSGDAFITGTTSSPNFPTKSPFQTKGYGGGTSDAFVAEIASNGTSLTYASYLGGSGADFGQGIALDSAGNAYVAGSTQSTDFPTAPSPGALRPSNAGGSDAFVAMVKSGGSALTYSTYLGGSGADYGQAIAVDGGNNAYVTGYTLSTNFPVANPLQASNGGNGDAFVAKLNSAGTGLIYSTYLGGNGLDRGFGIALDGAGDAFVTGDSTSNNFPATAGAFQGLNNGNGESNAFVAELNPAGSALVYFTYLGGKGPDKGTAIALDGSGNAYVTGSTQSSDFPVADALQPALGCSGANCSNAFVSKIGAGGTALAYSTYLGGSGADFGQAIAVDGSGNAYVAGGAASTNFPIIPGAFQPVYGGSGTQGDAFVAKVDPADAPALAASPASVSFGNQGTGAASQPQTVTLTDAGSASLTITSITANSPFQASGGTCGQPITLAPGANCTVNVTFTPTTTTASTGTLSVADNAAGSPQAIPLSGTGATPGPAVTLTPATSPASPLTFPTLTVGQTSAPQTVTLTNSGSAPLVIAPTSSTSGAIVVSSNYTETNDCPLAPLSGTSPSLAPGLSCHITITFTPGGTASTAGGSVLGSVTINDNASGHPHVISLSGVANPVYSLSSSNPSSTILVGTTSTTFSVAASAPAGFTSSINLSCSAAPGTSAPTCAFNPTSITPGQSSTVTVSGLSGITPNPDNFEVTGSTAATTSSTNQTAQAPLKIVLADFTLSATPPLDTITAGQSATYTVTATPLNGFNQAISFGCNSTMQAATCSFSPSTVTPNGGPVSTTLTLKTTANTASGALPRHPAPPRGLRVPGWVALLVITLLGLLAVQRLGQGSAAMRWRARVSLMALAGALLLVALASSCNDYTGFNIIVPNNSNGTRPGNYALTIVGTYTNSSSGSSSGSSVASCAGTTVGAGAITRCTGVNVSVGQ